MNIRIPALINRLFIEARAIEGISLGDEPIRFDVASPIISSWQDLKRERVESMNTTHDTHSFLQSVISVPDILVPRDREKTKKMFSSGISYVSVLFARNDSGSPVVMLRCYIPSEKKTLEFERLTTVLSKTYCDIDGNSWIEMIDDIKILGISEEFNYLIEKFEATIQKVKNRDEIEKEITKTII